MPLFNSNTLSRILNSSIRSEIIWLAINTSDLVTVIMLSNKQLGRMSKKGSQKKNITILLNKIFYRHFEVFSKFAARAKAFHILFKL